MRGGRGCAPGVLLKVRTTARIFSISLQANDIREFARGTLVHMGQAQLVSRGSAISSRPRSRSHEQNT